MKTTGPIVAVGAITLGNQVILNKRPVDWRIPIATGITAAMFAFLERVNERGAVAFAYLALTTVLFVRLGNTPSPMESLVKFMNERR